MYKLTIPKILLNRKILFESQKVFNVFYVTGSKKAKRIRREIKKQKKNDDIRNIQEDWMELESIVTMEKDVRVKVSYK